MRQHIIIVLTIAQVDLLQRLLTGDNFNGCMVTSREIDELASAGFLKRDYTFDNRVWFITERGIEAV